MQRRSMIRWGLLLAVVLLVAGGAVFGGHRLAGDLAKAESFRSIPPGRDGIAWVKPVDDPRRFGVLSTGPDAGSLGSANAQLVAAQTPGTMTDDPQAFCQHVAERVCHGPATYLDLGTGAPQANRFRERFRCEVAADARGG